MDQPSWLDPERLHAGGDFLFAEDATRDPIWGHGDDILWHTGEGFLLVGPTGVGKTTLTGQILLGLIGLRNPSVLGYPINGGPRRVLYLAGDRPDQFRRALLRCVRPEEHDYLNEWLTIWRGPSPQDIGKHPETLLEMARAANADVIVIDSLKDAASRLSDEETGTGYHRGVQLCLVYGIEVMTLHHQRKGQEGRKPTTIEDVYGSSWIANGAGSVILLWGEPGSPIVELSHLKQPAGTVGPFTVEHDHILGTSRVLRGKVDLHKLLPAGGATVIEMAARLHGDVPTDAQRKNIYRKLERLVQEGKVLKVSTTRGGETGTIPARYVPVRALDKPKDNGGCGQIEESSGQ